MLLSGQHYVLGFDMQEHVRDGIPMSGRTSDYRAWAAAIGKNVGITARTIREKVNGRRVRLWIPTGLDARQAVGQLAPRRFLTDSIRREIAHKIRPEVQSW
jgi:hypothetical protein